jgi:hypothetical protein
MPFLLFLANHFVLWLPTHWIRGIYCFRGRQILQKTKATLFNFEKQTALLSSGETTVLKAKLVEREKTLINTESFPLNTDEKTWQKWPTGSQKKNFLISGSLPLQYQELLGLQRTFVCLYRLSINNCHIHKLTEKLWKYLLIYF